MPNNYFTLTRQSGKIVLDAYSNGQHVGSMFVRTGLAGSQNFRTLANQVTGQNEPVPEGEYILGKLEWAGGKGNYSALYPTIKSPIWVEIIGWPRYIGFHFDAGYPGTAGCVGFITMNDLKTFTGWYDAYGHFSTLYVDWGLGSVKVPVLPKKEKPEQTSKAFCDGKQTTILLHNGKNMFTVEDLENLGLIKPGGHGKGFFWDGPTRTITLIKSGNK